MVPVDRATRGYDLTTKGILEEDLCSMQVCNSVNDSVE